MLAELCRAPYTYIEPEDIAHQAVHLLGPRGKFETYGAVTIDGGWI